MNRILVTLFCIASLPLLAERKLLKYEVVQYPPLALQAGMAGTVSATVAIAKDGTVKSIEFPENQLENMKLLVDVCETILKTWKFEASKKEGEESVSAIFVFHLNGPNEKEDTTFVPTAYMTILKRNRPHFNP